MAQTIEYQAVKFGLHFVESQNPDRSRDGVWFGGISVIRIDELSAVIGELVVELVFAEIAIRLCIRKNLAGRSSLSVMITVVPAIVIVAGRRRMIGLTLTVIAVMMK
ncbi:hypothetical protein WN67_13170 [Mycolicibacterium obuense]|uniref:Uncharacterized protein n=1 Tax=Mycolicibacterium obuense TaxID=1807 RepID=A0A0M2JY01_9MYCO|nr:hypothetical protein WN67_13170 [Mycolicibacterium obuense]